MIKISIILGANNIRKIIKETTRIFKFNLHSIIKKMKKVNINFLYNFFTNIYFKVSEEITVGII